MSSLTSREVISKAVTAMLTAETPANSSWQASSYQQWLSSFTWAISSLVSKTVGNGRVTARPQWFCLTLKSPWFSYLGCLPQPQPSLPVLLQGGCSVDNLYSVLQLLSLLSIPAARLKSSESFSASASTPFASSRSADIFMLHTAVQWMHKSPTYTCICTGTVSILVAAAWSSDRLIFFAKNSPFTSRSASAAWLYTWLHLFKVSWKNMHIQCYDDNHRRWSCTSQRLFDLEKSIFVVGSQYMF